MHLYVREKRVKSNSTNPIQHVNYLTKKIATDV
jgi:hypothetical protein